jgi:N-acetylmuramoyl-L-alanine amidase-like protein
VNPRSPSGRGRNRSASVSAALALALVSLLAGACARSARPAGRVPGTATAAHAAVARRAPRLIAVVYAGTRSVPALLPPPPIVKDFIPFGAKRKQEMRRYALEHYGIDSYRLIDPHLIIWHYTETATFQSVFNTFASDVPDVTYHELPQVCAHFVIDTNGTIYELVPIEIMCRQVVGLNYTAIGIENVGFSDQQVMGDAAQFHAGLELTRWLRCREHIPVSNVIGHNESLSSPYYRELVPAFRGQTHLDFNRTDMNVVRARVAQLPCRG